MEIPRFVILGWPQSAEQSNLYEGPLQNEIAPKNFKFQTKSDTKILKKT